MKDAQTIDAQQAEALLRAAAVFGQVKAMNNTGWCNARKAAGLGDLHVRDLRHTVGMRLREAGVAKATIADVLWHSTKTMTANYSMAQLVELHRALVLIERPAEGWNKSLAILREEAAMRAASHAKVTQKSSSQTIGRPD